MNIRAILSLLLCSLFHTTSQAQWSSFCTGSTTGYIMDFMYHGGDLYACGSITQIGGTAVGKVAKWDGAQWQPVGSFTDDVHKLESLDGGLYACKYNTVTTDSNWLYKWDGSQWQRFGDGFYLTDANAGQYHFASLYDAAFFNGRLVVSGEFDIAGGEPVKGIASWDGTKWTALGAGLDGVNGSGTPNIYPHKMIVYHNDLYVAGSFKNAGGIVVNGIARWDGTQWHAVGDGFNKPVYGIEDYNDTLYACGEFTASGANALGCIAKWDGSAWVSPGIKLGTSIPGYHAFGHTLKKIGAGLYLAGGFDKCTDAGGNTTTVGNVMEFAGNGWNGMDGGTNADVEGLEEYNGKVLVGGSYTQAGSIAVNSMALWHSITGISQAGIRPFRVYPNPVTDHIAIDNTRSGMKLRLANAQGQVVKTVEAQDGSTSISTNNLQPGIYILNVDGADHHTSITIVK